MCKVEAPITDTGPIVDFIYKSHTFLKVPSHLAVRKSVRKRHRKSKYDDQGGDDVKLSLGAAS